MDLHNFVINRFDLKNKTDEECFIILQQKLKEFDEVMSEMESLSETCKQKIIKKWKENTKNAYPNLDPNSDKDNCTDVTFHLPNGKELLVCIRECHDEFYCQVEYVPVSKISRDKELCLQLSDLLPVHSSDQIWRYVDYDCDAAYKLFVDVVERCKSIFSLS